MLLQFAINHSISSASDNVAYDVDDDDGATISNTVYRPSVHSHTSHTNERIWIIETRS